jgi:hypothetical protein
VLKFRHLLEKQALTQVIFEQINGHLAERGMLMREGTIVDATIIAAPPSTKNRARARGYVRFSMATDVKRQQPLGKLNFVSDQSLQSVSPSGSTLFSVEQYTLTTLIIAQRAG